MVLSTSVPLYLTNSSSALVYAIGTEDESCAQQPAAGAVAHYPLSNNGEPNSNASTLRSRATTSIHYRSTLNTMIKALRLWPPAYCITCQPFQVCTLLGPNAAHLEATFVAPSTTRGDLERDLIRETITCIAEYWEIGAATLGKLPYCGAISGASLIFRLDLMDVLNFSPSSDPGSYENIGDHMLRCLLPRHRTSLQATVK
jgi:hypothetical protein